MNNVKWHPIAIVVWCLVFTSITCHAAAVRITWNKNSDADLEGYTVYYGPSSRNYTNMKSAGLSTVLDIDTSELTASKVYYFAVTARDTYGNESVYSQEVSVAIPEIAASVEAPGFVVPLDTDNDGIPNEAEILTGLNPNDPLDALLDSDNDGAENLVEYMAGTDPLNPSNRPSSDGTLIDIIGEIGEIIDLTAINPESKYSFNSILASCPTITTKTVTMEKPGVYLYNVYDPDGVLVYCVRISIATKLFATGLFEPGSPLSLEELSLGISISLRADAAIRQIPIGIASSGSDASSVVQSSDGSMVEFELLPTDLALAVPAQISIEFNGEKPVVQRYNDSDGTWNTLAGVTSQDGLVSFSAQKLGKFRVYSESSGTTGKTSSSSGGGGGGGCFINTAGI